MGSDNQKALGERLPTEHHGDDSNNKPPAIIYDPSLDTFETVESGNLKSDCDSFPIHLPRWRNKVDIYVCPENRSGFVATVQLDRLGPAKNLQRRFGHKYRVLHVKGLKPGTAPRTSSSSSASMSVLKDGDHDG